MNKYTPLQYIKIAVANAMGLDKTLFEERIEWFDKQECLWELAVTADEPYQYVKAVYAYEDAINGIPTGYAMGLDATSSGAQIMSLLIGCETTAKQCNVINTGKRENAYDNIYQGMKQTMPELDYTAKEIKNVGMTVLYASKAEPKKLFGVGDELELFYAVMGDKFTGALEVMADILACRDAKALGYKWTLPDGHTSNTEISVTQEAVISVPELDDIPFTHLYSENKANKYSVAIVANIVHSVDGFITREFNLRTNHKGTQQALENVQEAMLYAPDLAWEGVPSISRALNCNPTTLYPLKELKALKSLLESLIKYPAFETYVVHDKFFSSPVHMQRVREVIHGIYVDIANSNLLSEILNEITGEDVEFTKITQDLSTHMTDAEYILS
jgi:hypothetical protein|tara:strand:+ start:2640 stop:3800 length:1161 start_codon:yes stop_codon:yes gene_type:complete